MALLKLKLIRAAGMSVAGTPFTLADRMKLVAEVVSGNLLGDGVKVKLPATIATHDNPMIAGHVYQALWQSRIATRQRARIAAAKGFIIVKRFGARTDLTGFVHDRLAHRQAENPTGLSVWERSGKTFVVMRSSSQAARLAPSTCL